MLSLINRHQSFMHFKFEDKVCSLHLSKAEKSDKTSPGIISCPKTVYYEHTSIVEFANARIMQRRKLSTVWKSTKLEEPGRLFNTSLVPVQYEVSYWKPFGWMLGLMHFMGLRMRKQFYRAWHLQGQRRYMVMGSNIAGPHAYR